MTGVEHVAHWVRDRFARELENAIPRLGIRFAMPDIDLEDVVVKGAHAIRDRVLSEANVGKAVALVEKAGEAAVDKAKSLVQDAIARGIKRFY